MVVGQKEPPSKGLAISDRIEKKRSETEDKAARDEEERIDQAKMSKAKASREGMVTDIANRTEDDKSLTLAQAEAVKKNPAIRMLIKKEFAKRKIETHKIFVDVVEESYKVGMGLRKEEIWRRDEDGKILVDKVPIREKERLKARRMVANTVTDLEGLELRAADRDRPPQVVHVHFHAAFDPKNKEFEEYDGNTIKIDAETSPGPDTDNPGSTLREIHNGDLRDQEWQNVPGHGDSTVLVGDTGE